MSRRLSLGGARVLLTGASSGIGRALALELARKGSALALVARREELLEDLAGEARALGAREAVALPTDLAIPGAAEEAANEARARLGEIDILINDAALGVGGSQWRVGDAPEGRQLFEVNLWAPLALTAALVPGMRERGRGAVVNVTSVSQVTAWGGLGHYSASKAALALSTETLRLELQGSGVRVLEVVAGPTDTAIQAESRLLPGFGALVRFVPLGRPEALARQTVRSLERGRRRLVYPRANLGPYLFPGVVRTVTPMLARLVPSIADDPRVVLGGSQGHDEARRAREAWPGA